MKEHTLPPTIFVDEFALVTRMSGYTVRAKIRSGEIPASRNGKIRINPEVLKNYGVDLTEAARVIAAYRASKTDGRRTRWKKKEAA